MFRTTVNATERTDVVAEVASLRKACARAGISPVVVDLIASEVGDTLSELVSRGRQLASMGSQMTVTRKIAGEGYDVSILFNAKERRSLFAWLVEALRLR